MKARFESLTINAYGSRVQKKDPSDLKFAVCQSVCPENASAEEKRIYQYLDDQKIFMLDAKQVLEHQIDKDCHSPILAQQFLKKQQIYSAQMRGPSFLQRRMEQKASQLSVGVKEGCASVMKQLKSETIKGINNENFGSVDSCDELSQVSISGTDHHYLTGANEKVILLKTKENLNSNNIDYEQIQIQGDKSYNFRQSPPIFSKLTLLNVHQYDQEQQTSQSAFTINSDNKQQQMQIINSRMVAQQVNSNQDDTGNSSKLQQ
ncbi:UNKNOWN [Stylonychia lemnae]|uniref:Uncharacterized protein n=1 Tax=Stylonychia lemnae TaxID=5949 RepID=A0A077ZWV1_STYLE|nr:UNKNOWN [Stylonychia lemnae]|eukprot:CDW74396.1 UNKNOWN [Stylonychia lemnae]